MDSPMYDEYNNTWSHAGNPGAVAGRATKRRRTDVNEGPAQPTQERGIMRDGHEPGLPRFIGSSSGIHLIRTVYDVLARSHVDRSRNRHDATADVVPGEEDQLAGPSPSDPRARGGLPVTPFWQPDEIRGSAATITFNSLLQWTESYFNYWHPIFPLLHGPVFLGILEQVAENGIESLNQADAIIVRSILSISLADSRQISGHRHSFPPNLILLNQDDIAASLNFVLSSPASINNIQAALCVELFLVSMLNFNMASRVGGIIIRMSFNLGLHRCPTRFTNFSAHDASMRRRLWWSIYCLDRLVCQTLGLPLGIKDDDIDVCLPSEELHSPGRDSQSNDTDLRAGQLHEYEKLQLLVMLSKHAKLRGMILELRNKSIRFRREDSGRALRVQAELKRWTNEIYDLTSTNPTSRNSPAENPSGDNSSDTSDDYIHPSHKILLVTLQHELILSLYRPLLAADLETPSSQAAFQECINASRTIIDTAADNPKSLRAKESNLKDGHLLWPSLTWSIWMSCFVLTYAAMEGITTAASAKRYAKRALRVLKLLSLRKTSWPDKCTLAVEQLIVFLGHREPNEGPSPSNIRCSHRRPSLSQSTHHTKAARTPTTSNQAHNPEILSQGDGRWPHSHQPRFDDQGSASSQSQSVPSLAGMNLPGTTDSQDFLASEFPGFTSNITFEYANMLGGMDHMYANPLVALDFANFAQDPNAQSMILDHSLGSN
ncbi:fungal-specific transcription factor domain-containing protein [Xylaria sp. FL1042]|nr:fungal-specific transcription factor domain-containing protein [Xylaria sp. FL1042]